MNKNVKRVGTFVWVGVVLTIIDYLICELITFIFFKDADKTNIAAAISGALVTILAYFMHSRITWKGREITKLNVVKFFVWNIFVMVLVRPFAIDLFSKFTWLYDFAHSLLSWAFSHEFVTSTGTYVLATIVTMTLNFLFYDRFVFKEKGGKKINMESVRKTREEKKRKAVRNNDGEEENIDSSTGGSEN